MKTTRRRPQGRALRTFTTALVLTLLAALLLAGTALAAAKPGRPTAKAPKSTVTTTKPTFTWSKTARAAKYEVRVYQGKKVVLKKTGLKKASYRAVKALPAGVELTWKVRGSNSVGRGAWSRSLKFTVTPRSSEKAITGFAVPGQTGATVINETLKTIALTVPSGTDVTALVPTITITGTGVNPASGAPHDFTSAATYTVTAADATTQPYIVTVTVAAPLAIGDWYEGGYVAYIFTDGDPGYIAGQTHGLIAASMDQDMTADGIIWTLPAYAWTSVPAGTSTAIGTGAANTEAIISQNGAGTTYAAGLARAYTMGIYSDWYLPSRDELNKLYLNQAKIGQFDNTSGTFYWSSSEYDSDSAYGQYFMNGSFESSLYKEYAKGWVRAVRTF